MNASQMSVAVECGIYVPPIEESNFGNRNPKYWNNNCFGYVCHACLFEVSSVFRQDKHFVRSVLSYLHILASFWRCLQLSPLFL